jgi:hypothetical protein
VVLVLPFTTVQQDWLPAQIHDVKVERAFTSTSLSRIWTAAYCSG